MSTEGAPGVPHHGNTDDSVATPPRGNVSSRSRSIRRPSGTQQLQQQQRQQPGPESANSKPRIPTSSAMLKLAQNPPPPASHPPVNSANPENDDDDWTEQVSNVIEDSIVNPSKEALHKFFYPPQRNTNTSNNATANAAAATTTTSATNSKSNTTANSASHAGNRANLSRASTASRRLAPLPPVRTPVAKTRSPSAASASLQYPSLRSSSAAHRSNANTNASLKSIERTPSNHHRTKNTTTTNHNNNNNNTNSSPNSPYTNNHSSHTARSRNSNNSQQQQQVHGIFDEHFRQQANKDQLFVERFWTTFDDILILSIFTQIGILFRLASSTWFSFFDNVFSADSALFVNLPLNCLSCFLMGILCSGERLMEIIVTRFSPPRLQVSLQAELRHDDYDRELFDHHNNNCEKRYRRRHDRGDYDEDDGLGGDHHQQDDYDEEDMHFGNRSSTPRFQHRRSKHHRHRGGGGGRGGLRHSGSDLGMDEEQSMNSRGNGGGGGSNYPMSDLSGDMLDDEYDQEMMVETWSEAEDGSITSGKTHGHAQRFSRGLRRRKQGRMRRRKHRRQQLNKTLNGGKGGAFFHSWQPPLHLNDDLRDVQLLALERRIRASKCLVLFPVKKEDVDVMEHYFQSGYKKDNKSDGGDYATGGTGYTENDDPEAFDFDLALEVEDEDEQEAKQLPQNNSSTMTYPSSPLTVIRGSPGNTISPNSTMSPQSDGTSSPPSPVRFARDQEVNDPLGDGAATDAEEGILSTVELTATITSPTSSPTKIGSTKTTKLDASGAVAPANTSSDTLPPTPSVQGETEESPHDLEVLIHDVTANVTENISRLRRVDLADGWDVGTTPEAMSDDLMLGLRDGFCGALSSFSSWNSAMVSLMRHGRIGEAFIGYMLGLQLPIIAYRFGQHIAVYVFIWRCRRETKRDERRGYGIRVAMNDEDPSDDEMSDDRSGIASGPLSPESIDSGGGMYHKRGGGSSIQNQLPSVRAVITAVFIMALVTQCTSLSFFGNPENQQIALSLLFSPLGVLARWRLSKLNTWRPSFPIGTFSANILACALSGSLGALLAGNPGPRERIWMQSFIAGFGGTLSSLATFVVEVLAGIDPILFRYDGMVYASLSIFWAMVTGFVFSASVDWADDTS